MGAEQVSGANSGVIGQGRRGAGTIPNATNTWQSTVDPSLLAAILETRGVEVVVSFLGINLRTITRSQNVNRCSIIRGAIAERTSSRYGCHLPCVEPRQQR